MGIVCCTAGVKSAYSGRYVLSTFTVEVVPIKLEPHPNADTLSIVKVYGYNVIVKTDGWRDGQLAAYVPPDSLVDTSREEFAFLGDHPRVTVRRFRGVYSEGLLVPAPEGTQAGDDVAEHLGVTHYEPPLPGESGDDAERPPAGFRPAYDVESWRRYPHLLVPGEAVTVSEKVHGANGRWCWQDGRFWCGSKREWKKEHARNLWWRVLREHEALRTFLERYPGFTVYGEVYGSVQELKYGTRFGELRFAIFDLWDMAGAEFVNAALAENTVIEHGLPWVPVIYRGPYDAAEIAALADGPSLIPGANHVREGIVVRPAVERIDPDAGRVQLKIVSNAYLERAK